jgi:hypothetical protein
VKSFFYGKQSPVFFKVIAPYAVWLEWERIFISLMIGERKESPYKAIENYIKAPLATKKVLLRYSKSDFIRDFYNAFIIPSMLRNPLAIKKPRKQLHPDIDMQEVRRVSKWIFNIIYPILEDRFLWTQSSQDYPFKNAVKYTAVIIERTYPLVTSYGNAFYSNFINFGEPKKELCKFDDPSISIKSCPIPSITKQLLIRLFPSLKR